jgi:hypothetical protein
VQAEGDRRPGRFTEQGLQRSANGPEIMNGFAACANTPGGRRLEQIMRGIHDRCLCTAEDCGAPGNYVVGANVAAFTGVADAMLALGMV